MIPAVSIASIDSSYVDTLRRISSVLPTSGASHCTICRHSKANHRYEGMFGSVFYPHAQRVDIADVVVTPSIPLSATFLDYNQYNYEQAKMIDELHHITRINTSKSAKKISSFSSYFVM